MSEEVDPRRRSAETKLRRTREKLIHAADHVMREVGLTARVEAIAEEAGVSKATFYNFYKSRNLLCMDAFSELVLRPAERAGMGQRPLSETAAFIAREGARHHTLLCAALIGRLEASRELPSGPRLLVREEKDGSRRIHLAYERWETYKLYGAYDFAARTASLLADDQVLARDNEEQAVVMALQAAALLLLDSVVRGEHIDTQLLAETTTAAASLRITENWRRYARDRSLRSSLDTD